MEYDDRVLYDYGLVPVVYDDFGHYLFMVESFRDYMLGDGEWKLPPTSYSLGQRTIVKANQDFRRKIKEYAGTVDFSDIVLIDKKLRFASLIDLLIWDNNKYRIYLCHNRVSSLCRERSYAAMVAQLALSGVSKNRLTDWIHTDYAFVGKDLIHHCTENDRKQHVKLIHRVNSILRGVEYLTVEGSNGSLYPNQKAGYTSYIFKLPSDLQKKKDSVCFTNCDISVLWQCGNVRRHKIKKNGIHRWDDPEFVSQLKEYVPEKYATIIERMVSLSQTNDLLDIPKLDELTSQFPDLFSSDISSWMFTDFETDFQKCIYLFGFSSVDDGHQCEWASSISLDSEKDLMRRVYTTVTEHKKNGGNVCYFYAEDSFWRERCDVHGFDEYKDLFQDALDLHKVFVNGPILINKCFNFKLKNIANVLYQHNQIPISQPDGCADGAESVELAKNYFRTGSQEIYQTLKRYNEFDCEVLLHLMIFIRGLYI